MLREVAFTSDFRSRSILKEYSVGSLHRYQEISGGGASHGRRSNSELLEQIPVGRGSVLLDEFDDEAAACPDASDLHRRGNRSQSGTSGCRVTLLVSRSTRHGTAELPRLCLTRRMHAIAMWLS